MGKGGKGKGGKKGGKALPEEMHGRQVFVGNLSWQTSWRGLKDHMKTIGEVEYCDVMMDRDGRSAGSGLVRFATTDEATKAIKELTDSTLDDRTIFVREDRENVMIKGLSDKGKGKKGKGKGKGKKGKQEWSVWVGPIDKSMDWKGLKDAFNDYNPTHADVGEIRNGANRGFGVVKFAKASEAEEAIENVKSIDAEKCVCKWDNDSFGFGKGSYGYGKGGYW